MRQIRKKKASSSNKKVRNATPVEADGIKFRSKLELYCYKKLKENGIEADYEKTTFVIIDAFVYNGEKVRKMTYTPDFVSDTFIIECKGNPNEAFPLRWKMFKRHLHDNNTILDLYLPRNRKQIDEMIEILKLKQAKNE